MTAGDGQLQNALTRQIHGLRVPFDASSLIVTVPVFTPTLVGVNRTPIVQFPPAATLPVVVGQVPPALENPAPALTTMLETAKAALPVLERVMVLVADGLPVFCFPKSTDAGDTAATGAAPVPVTDTFSVEALLLVTAIVPLTAPTAVGANRTLTLHDAPLCQRCGCGTRRAGRDDRERRIAAGRQRGNGIEVQRAEPGVRDRQGQGAVRGDLDVSECQRRRRRGRGWCNGEVLEGIALLGDCVVAGAEPQVLDVPQGVVGAVALRERRTGGDRSVVGDGDASISTRCDRVQRDRIERRPGEGFAEIRRGVAVLGRCGELDRSEDQGASGVAAGQSFAAAVLGVAPIAAPL